MNNSQKERSKAITPLIQNAKKGDLQAQYQLHKYYAEGKYVEKNDDLSLQYYQQLENSLIGKNLRLKSLKLYEFRRFHTLDINFSDKVTVIIGDNGAGKTSIAEAISKALSWFNNNLEKENVNGKPVIPADINVDSSDYSEVTSKFQFNKNDKFEVSLSRVVPGFIGSQQSEVSVIKKIGAMYRITAKNTSIVIPLLAFYSVDRSDFKLTSTVSEKASGETTRNRFSALEGALEGSGKLDDFSELYIQLVNLSEGENTKDVKDLRNQISTLENSINEVYEGKYRPADDPFSAKLSSKKEELASLLQLTSSPKYQRQLNFVNIAIETLVPDVKNLEIDRSSGKPRLLVQNFGNKVNISQLSQGQKMLVALTGDLARRLVTLNPEADNPLHGHGIVIIDEIELHLHPKWQQEILTGLQNTFLNIQFIVTTHSPQVLSTVDNKCIRQICLNKQGDPVIKTPEFQTKGVTSADILARIMETNSVPEKLEEAEWVNQFSKHLSTNNKAKSDKYFDKIKSHFGAQHPVVLECESQIRIAEMNIRLAGNK